MYLFFFNSGWKVEDYNPNKSGLRVFGNKLFLYHDRLIVNSDQLVESLDEAKREILKAGDPCKVILYNGQNINNNVEDVFLKYNPNTGEIWR